MIYTLLIILGVIALCNVIILCLIAKTYRQTKRLSRIDETFYKAMDGLLNLENNRVKFEDYLDYQHWKFVKKCDKEGILDELDKVGTDELDKTDTE